MHQRVIYLHTTMKHGGISTEKKGTHRMKKIFLSACVCTVALSYGKAQKVEHNYLSKGNLAVSTSQQPGPLFSFGQNIIDPGDLQIYAYIDHLKGRNCRKDTDASPALVYGVTENFSLYINIPVATKLQCNTARSSGIGDLLIQGEYVIHEKEAPTHENLITLVAGISLPTGSTQKEPTTGIGAPGFFMGSVASHLSHEWYLFASPGALFTTSHHGTKFGNQFFYEFGFGKNLAYKKDSFVVMWMIECDGIYSQRTRECNITNPNTGGNIFYIGPSLWFSTDRLIIQGGVAFPVAQHLHGIQSKEKYFAAVNIGVTF